MLTFQELIYKEFFSQGDLVCGVRPQGAQVGGGFLALDVSGAWRGPDRPDDLMPAGEGHGQQADGDDGP